MTKLYNNQFPLECWRQSRRDTLSSVTHCTKTLFAYSATTLHTLYSARVLETIQYRHTSAIR